MNAALNPLDRVAPHAVRESLLASGDLAELLDFALVHEAAFEPTRLAAARLDPSYRVSRGLPRAAFEPWRKRLRDAIAPLVPGLLADLGMSAPADMHYELELVRHNDGDFYRRHIDTKTATSETPGRRVLSMVYYFHAEPRANSGGALRLLSFRQDAAHTDIEPGQNRLVAFPSWAPHQVMPVSCPSGRFRDSRFAVNCWVWGGARAAPPVRQS